MSSTSDTVRTHANQALLTLVTKLAMMAMRLVRNIILARVLGAADRGAFAFLVALPELIISLLGAGLQTSAARQAAGSDRPETLLMTTATIGLVFGVLCAGLSVAAFQFPGLFRGYHETVETYAVLVAIVTAILSVKFLFNQFLIGAGWVGAMNASRFLETALLFVFMLSFFAVGFTSLDGVIAAWVLAYLVLMGFMIGYARSRGALSLNFDQDSARDFFSFGARGHADMIFQRLMSRSDYVFISGMLGAEALGYYAVAVIGAEILMAVPEAVNAPLTRRLLGSGKVDQAHLALMLTRWVILTVSAFGLLGALCADWGVRCFFGDEFAPAVPALIMLIPAVTAASGAGFLRLALLGQDKPGIVSIVLGIAAAANLALNWWLIPIYGIVGAAAASTLSYVVGFMVLYITVVRLCGLKWFDLFIITRTEIAMIRRSARDLVTNH